MRIKNKYFLSFFLPFLLLNNEAKQKKRDVTHWPGDRSPTSGVTDTRFFLLLWRNPNNKSRKRFFFFFLKSILYKKKNRRKNTHDESRITFMKKETFSRPLLGYWFKLLNDLNRHVSHGMKKKKKSLIHLAPLLYLLLYDGATASSGWQAPINLLLVLCV
jgi:hypothetical protein